MSHEMAISQGPRRSMVSKATCAAPSCEALSPCRGLRPHHARKDRVGTWETSSGPQSLQRSRAAAGRRGAEAAAEQARSRTSLVVPMKRPNKAAMSGGGGRGGKEARSEGWRTTGDAPDTEPDQACCTPSPACGSALRSNLRARPIAPDLRQEPGAGCERKAGMSLPVKVWSVQSRAGRTGASLAGVAATRGPKRRQRLDGVWH